MTDDRNIWGGAILPNDEALGPYDQSKFGYFLVSLAIQHRIT